MVPVPGCRISPVPCLFYKACSGGHVHAKVRIKEIEGFLFIGLGDYPYGTGFIPVIRIDHTDDITRCHGYTLVHCIIDPFIGFGYYGIRDTLFLKRLPVVFCYLQGIIP